MREITYNEIQLVRFWLKGYCPKCAAKGDVTLLVHYQASGSVSGIEDYCQQCKEAWPGKRIESQFFQEMTDPDIKNLSRSLSKVPDGILND